MNRKPAPNSSYKKLAVQFLNKHLCFVSNAVVADSFMISNPTHRKVAERLR